MEELQVIPGEQICVQILPVTNNHPPAGAEVLSHPALSHAGRSHRLLATSQSSQTRSSFVIKLCPMILSVDRDADSR